MRINIIFCSKVYRVQAVCHLNLDDRYVDGLKMVYVQFDSTTRVQANCDYNKSKKGNTNIIKCAGAAEITFHV